MNFFFFFSFHYRKCTITSSATRVTCGSLSPSRPFKTTTLKKKNTKKLKMNKGHQRWNKSALMKKKKTAWLYREHQLIQLKIGSFKQHKKKTLKKMTKRQKTPLKNWLLLEAEPQSHKLDKKFPHFFLFFFVDLVLLKLIFFLLRGGKSYLKDTKNRNNWG